MVVKLVSGNQHAVVNVQGRPRVGDMLRVRREEILSNIYWLTDDLLKRSWKIVKEERTELQGEEAIQFVVV